MEQHLALGPAYVPTYVLKIWQLPDDSDLLIEAWQDYRDTADRFGMADFVMLVETILGVTAPDEIFVCGYCNDPGWQEDVQIDVDGNAYCEPCRDNNGSSCDTCGDWSTSEWWLNTCCDTSLCSSCWSDSSYYCERCEQSYLGCCEDDHDHGEDYCQCSPQDLHFEILANSHGSAHQDERIHVELPAGHLSDEAIRAVGDMLWNDQLCAAYNEFAARGYSEPVTPYHGELRVMLEEMDRRWQTKDGNFTRRLSKALYKNWGIKLDTGLLSRAGSVARQHAETTAGWHVEFTRDLNQPAGNFFHEESCWWQSYNESLCALKHWGGVGIRTYADSDSYRDNPTGRAWLQPLDEDMAPTQDVRNAHAYVVYNGYGELSGYKAARIVAYLTSKTYRKIEFSAYHQYVNSGGFLIADQDVCDATESIQIGNGLGIHTKVAA